MKHAAVTMPIPEWEIPAAADLLPTDRSRHSPVQKPAERHPRSPVAVLADRTFMARLNTSDMAYMAKAILQLCDENHELRERVRRLEEGRDQGK